MIFKSELELSSAIQSRCHNLGVIGIDGWTSVGKTTLGIRLAEITGGSVYDLDCALEKDQGNYLESIQLNVIKDVLAKSKGILFLSGICLREILKRVDHPAIAHVYVKRMATWGWADEDEVAGTGLAEIEASSGARVRCEMRSYHKKWVPHIKADFFFHRTV
jgi:hypothetical protein